MARIPGTFVEVVYTYYRDVVIRMSGVQKKQAALIPNGVNPGDFEVMVSNLTFSEPLLRYGAANIWQTLPTLSNFSDEFVLYTCEINVDEGTPVSKIEPYLQFTLTVRKKANHNDYATGVIRLLPILDIVPPPPPPKPLWDGKYTIGVIATYIRVEKTMAFNTDGTWTDTNNANSSFNSSGRWLPDGKTGANYSMRCRDVTTIIAQYGSLNSTVATAWQKMNVQRKITVVGNLNSSSSSNPSGDYETRWYGIIDIRNDTTGVIEYSGWYWTRAITRMP